MCVSAREGELVFSVVGVCLAMTATAHRFSTKSRHCAPRYVVMFKQGAFVLGRSIVPVAIKYNKVFVDPYWNSRKMSFATHLFRLMTVREPPIVDSL